MDSLDSPQDCKYLDTYWWPVSQSNLFSLLLFQATSTLFRSYTVWHLIRLSYQGPPILKEFLWAQLLFQTIDNNINFKPAIYLKDIKSSSFANVIILLESSFGTGNKYFSMLFTCSKEKEKENVKNAVGPSYGRWLNRRANLNVRRLNVSRKKIYPFSQPWREIVKNQVGVCLRHCADVRNIVPHHNIGQSKICRWTIW